MEREQNSGRGKETTVELDGESNLEGGGFPSGFDDYPDDSISKHKAITARWIAYLLIIMLGGSFVIHYGFMAWLASQNKTAAMEVVARTFGAWLPVISGLAASAVTYFVTKDRDERR